MAPADLLRASRSANALSPVVSDKNSMCKKKSIWLKDILEWKLMRWFVLLYGVLSLIFGVRFITISYKFGAALTLQGVILIGAVFRKHSQIRARHENR
jgi:uncharacterized membrane protein HdeD (DUF308 family)